MCLNSMNMSQRAQFIFLLNYKLNVPLFKEQVRVKLLTHVCIYIALSTMWPIADPILNRYQPGYVNSSSHCWCYCYTFCLKSLNRSCRCLVCLKHVEMGHIIRNHILLIFWDNGVDERTSPIARPGKDWASCLPCHSNSTAWFHHPATFFYNYPIKFSQKSWCCFWWQANFPRPHCKNCPILPVCIAQHQKDQALPYTACNTTSCPGPCHF